MSNSSSNTTLSSSLSEDYATFNLVVIVIRSIIICVATGGNILTITAIYKFNNLRYPSNIMIAALAVSDLLMVTVYTPIIMIRSNNPNAFTNKVSCLTVIFIAKTTVVGNIAFLCLLSVERFYAVQFPFHYHKTATVRLNVVWSLLLFLGIILLNLPSVFGVNNWSLYQKCYWPLMFPKWHSTFSIGVLLVFQITSLLATSSVLRAELKIRNRNQSLRLSDFEKQESLQSTVMVMAYVISVCLYLPHTLYYLGITFLKQKSNHVLLETLFLLDLCSPAVNCFIYALKNSRFREAYRTLLGCKSLQVEP